MARIPQSPDVPAASATVRMPATPPAAGIARPPGGCRRLRIRPDQAQGTATRRIVRTVNALDRRPEAGQIISIDMMSLAGNELTQVDDFQEFPPTECLERRSAQSDLDRPALEIGAAGVVVRVPLQSYVRLCHRRLPVFSGGKQMRIESGWHCIAQQFVEKCPAQPQPQDDFLPLFRRPSGPIHHPQEIRLDPTHPFIGKFSAEPSILDREADDRRPISLIYDDRIVVEMRQDMLALCRPPCLLGGNEDPFRVS